MVRLVAALVALRSGLVWLPGAPGGAGARSRRQCSR